MSLGFKKSQLGGAREPRAQMVTVPPRGPGPERSRPLTLARSWPFPFPAASVIPQGGAGPPAFSAMSLLPSLRVTAGPPRASGLQSFLPPTFWNFLCHCCSQSPDPHDPHVHLAPSGMEPAQGRGSQTGFILQGVTEQRLMPGRAWAQGSCG